MGQYAAYIHDMKKKPNPDAISVRLPPDLGKWLREKAYGQKRSLSNMVELLLDAIRKEEKANK